MTVAEAGSTVEAVTGGCIVGRFEAVVRTHGARVAYESVGQRTTYDELNRLANRFAHGLLEEVPDDGRAVALCLGQGLELIVGILGTLKARRTVVVLDSLGGLAGAVATLVESEAGHLVQSTRDALIPTDAAPSGCRLLRVERLASGRRETDPGLPGSPDAPAFLIFTSGTTGRPKAVIRLHRGVVWNSDTLGRAWGHDSGVRLCFVAAYTSGNGISNIFRALLRGGTILGFDLRRSGLEALGEWIREAQATELVTSASVYRHLASVTPPGLGFPSVQLVRLGSEAVLARDFAEFERLFSEGCQFVNALSCTEAGTFTGFSLRHGARVAGRSIPLGTALEGVTVRLLDPAGREVGVDEPGEVVMHSPGLSGGYWRRPELTARAFRATAFDSGRSHYHTGDLAVRRSDGCIEYLGRLDRRVRVRGLGVEPDGIEAVLTSHPAIQGAAICAREIEGGEHELSAFYSLRPGHRMGPEEVRALVRAELPEQAVPGRCVRLESIPRSPNGKPDRAALEAMRHGTSGPLPESVPPRTEVERAVASIWTDVLGGVRPGLEDSFLEVGGQSLSATRVLARVRSNHGVDISLREFLRNPTVGWLALALSAGRAGRGAAKPGHVGGDAWGDLASAQMRMWLMDRMDPAAAAYNMPWLVRIRGPLDEEALDRSLVGLWRRHESLRTSFPVNDGVPCQRLNGVPGRVLETMSLPAAAAGERERAIESWARTEAWRPFDLERGPLGRAVLVRVDAEHHVLLLVFHHLVIDRWSRAVLTDEWLSLYGSFREGRDSRLEEPVVQFRDFVAWERGQLDPSRLAPRLAYWRRQLAGLVPVRLPADRPGNGNGRSPGGVRGGRMHANRIRALQALARQEGVSLFVLLLAAFHWLLGRLTGQVDIVTGTAVSNRPLAEFEGLIGFFTNTLVLRGNLAGDPGFDAFLQRLWRTALDAYEYQDVPFGRLVQELNPTRGTGAQPLCQVYFTLQNAIEPAVRVPGMEFEMVEIPARTARADLVVTAVLQRDSSMTFRWEFDAGRFSEDRVEEWMDAYDRLLDAVLESPTVRLGQLRP